MWDSIRKTIETTSSFCLNNNIPGWRQSDYQLRQTKKLFRKCQNVRYSNSKDPEKIRKKEQVVHDVHRQYINKVEEQLMKAEESLIVIDMHCPVAGFAVKEYIRHAKRQISQIERRVIKDETIPHDEKIFSIFEPHTDWIVKGKAGVSQELGLLVNIVKDQYGFILHHQVMEKQKDVHVAVSLIEETKKRFSSLNQCSFDKNYHSPSNKEQLEQLLDHVIMPKKGRLSKKDQEIEQSESFKKAKRKHSSVESAINALENHGLDRCLDHGIKGFKRYVSLAVLARNIQHLGNHIQMKKMKQQKKQRLKQAA